MKNLRKSNKLSKLKMAKLLEIEKSYLIDLEKGRIPSELNMDILANINKKFGVNPSNMFSPNYKEDD